LLKLVENADDQAAADPSLLRILARAHHIQARLSQNPKLTVHDIAREAFCKFPRAPFSVARNFWLCLAPAAGSVPEKSQPRNGAGEIFTAAAAESVPETVSAANRLATQDQ
jgi:hypothetical protein